MTDLVPVEIQISESAYTNAKLYYEHKKKNVVKEKKTIEASNQALKQAEKTAIKEIEHIKTKS